MEWPSFQPRLWFQSPALSVPTPNPEAGHTGLHRWDPVFSPSSPFQMLFSGSLLLPGCALLLQTSTPLLKVFSWSQRPFSSPCSHPPHPYLLPPVDHTGSLVKTQPDAHLLKDTDPDPGICSLLLLQLPGTTNTSGQAGVLPEEYSFPSFPFLSPPLVRGCPALSHCLGHTTCFGRGMWEDARQVETLNLLHDLAVLWCTCHAFAWRRLPRSLWAKENKHMKQIWTQSTSLTQVQSTWSFKQNCFRRPLGPWDRKNKNYCSLPLRVLVGDWCVTLHYCTENQLIYTLISCVF